MVLGSGPLATLERTTREVGDLWPRGPVWSRRAPRTRALVEALAAEAYRATLKLEQLADELDPRTTEFLLPHWERVAGLPDPCALDLTVEERRAALVARLAGAGGASRRFFIDLATSLGFADVWIEEHEADPPRCGVARCGDALDSEQGAYVWTVHTAETEIHESRCGMARCGDSLRWWGSPLLECVIARLAPAHTHVTFAYDSIPATIRMAVPGGVVALEGDGRMLVPGGWIQTDGQVLDVPGGTVELENDQGA